MNASPYTPPRDTSRPRTTFTTNLVLASLWGATVVAGWSMVGAPGIAPAVALMGISWFALSRTTTPWLYPLNRQRMTVVELITLLPPSAHGGAMVVSARLLQRLAGKALPLNYAQARETKRSEMLAMEAVMRAERELGHAPRDISALNCGYNIESACGKTGRLRFIEVKGRVAGAETVTVTRNEIVTGVNCAESYILAIVQTENDQAMPPDYVRAPYMREPDSESRGAITKSETCWTVGDRHRKNGQPAANLSAAQKSQDSCSSKFR